MDKPLDCTVKQVDEKGRGRCACSLVTATGGECKVFGPRPTFAEAFPYLTTPAPRLGGEREGEGRADG